MEKPNFCAFPIEKYRQVTMTSPPRYLRLLTGHPDPIEGGTSDFFFTKITAKDELITIYKLLVKYLGVSCNRKKIYRGVTSTRHGDAFFEEKLGLDLEPCDDLTSLF